MTENTDSEIRIVGLIRFSYPCLGGFQTKYDSEEQKLETLFSPERMEERFRIFEFLCLHTLKNQTDKDFTIGILIGESMPQEYVNRLQVMLEGFEQATLITLPIMQYRAAMIEAYKRLDSRESGHRIEFRLDDDDAVSYLYIQRLREHIPALKLLGVNDTPVSLAFMKGILVRKEAQENELVPYISTLPTSVGLAVYTPVSWGQTIYHFLHQRINLKMSIIGKCDEFMFIRTLHGSNDSRGLLFGDEFRIAPARLSRQLQRKFGVSPDHLRML